MRVAIYARCSTADQSVNLQLDALREYARARRLELVAEFVDEAVSGAKARRPALDRLLEDAHRRRFDAVLVWKLDRLGRSLSHLLRVAETAGRVGGGPSLPGRCRPRHDRSRGAVDLRSDRRGRRVRAGPDPRAHSCGSGSGAATREADRPTPRARARLKGEGAPRLRAAGCRGRPRTRDQPLDSS